MKRIGGSAGRRVGVCKESSAPWRPSGQQAMSKSSLISQNAVTPLRRPADTLPQRDGTLGIWVVRKEAEELGRYLEVKLGGHLGGLDCSGGETNRDGFASRCASYRQWVLVMATGIAVRYLEGLIKDKRSDPGVVVIDEGCRYAVSLLGGHEGGANFLAYRVANLTG